MRLATIKRNGNEGLAVVLPGESAAFCDLTLAAELLTGSIEVGALPNDMQELIRSWDHVSKQLQTVLAHLADTDYLSRASLDGSQLRLCAPIERPGKIVCLAGNYREHIVESGFVPPEQSAVFTPQLFLKPATAIVGNDDDIVIGRNNITVGWETELAVVIGKRGRNIMADQAYGFVFGYTVLNDVSERSLNSRIENRTRREMDGFLDWLAGKWFDSFAPCGPWIVTADEIADPHQLEIKLTVNGQVRQQGNTRDMLFSIPEQIAYISSIMTLEPGDIISTGTPVGAGVGGNTALEDGDELVCEIEKIGKLRNRARRVN